MSSCFRSGSPAPQRPAAGASGPEPCPRAPVLSCAEGTDGPQADANSHQPAAPDHNFSPSQEKTVLLLYF